VITPATALQIAGRAGRYASQFVEGEVTTFTANDLPMLQKLLNTPVEPVQVDLLHAVVYSLTRSFAKGKDDSALIVHSTYICRGEVGSGPL